jgi:Cofilin/tropomyosin-type actin-binding protein
MSYRPLPKVSSFVRQLLATILRYPHMPISFSIPICARLLFHTIIQAWAEIRDNGNPNVDWLIAGYDNGSKTDITVLQKGSGGVEACAAALPDDEPVFGGFRLSNGRFRHFYYAPDAASVMKKGRASMHKNGVLNVMEGCDGEVYMRPGLTEPDI